METVAELDPRQLVRAADRGAAYLLQNLRSNGKFVYQRNADTGCAVPGTYNLLRHFGSLWVMLEVGGGDPVVRARSVRGLSWAIERYYVRTRSGGAFRKKDWLVTGCSGLALLAIDQLGSPPGSAIAGIRTEIVRYLLANQIQDPADSALHDFRHKISMDVPVVDGVYDDVTVAPATSPFRSTFYTGEILFGLIAGAGREAPGLRQQVHAAVTRSMSALQARDFGVDGGPHWIMYAIRRYCETVECRRDMVAWASRISASALATRVNRDTRTAPMACRVEAQVQFLALLDGVGGGPEHAELRTAVMRQVQEDCALLLQLQDKWTGGFVGSADDPIMQIDYTQHAVSALMGAATVLRS